jgi:FAD/FMN-containing dehydrogenase
MVVSEEKIRSTANALEAADVLQACVSGGAILPWDEAYSQGCRVWNGGVQQRPAIIAFCRSSEDVAVSVRLAREHGLLLSVRGGGHDWAGRALCDGGLVIDLTGMREVGVDSAARVATIAGGARVRDVAVAADAAGLVAALGNCGAVGMAGLTLGGGYGPLNSTLGLAADNLLRADMVLANGQRVTVGPEEKPDLFWALRGGGGNFGVVTSMQVRLHEQRTLLSGALIAPATEAVLHRYAAFAATMPEPLGVTGSVMAGPDGRSAVQFVPLWNGDPDQGERVMADLESALDLPEPAQIGPVRYADMLAGFDAWIDSLDGHHWAFRTRWLPTLEPGAIAEIVTAVAKKTSSFAAVSWHHLRGAAARVTDDATPFGLRRSHFMLEILAAWTPEEGDGSLPQQWTQALDERLAPFALPGGYANVLGPDDRERARDAFGGNAARLCELKRQFDPDNVFASAIPLPTD